MANTGAVPGSPVRAIRQLGSAVESRELARTEVAAPQPRCKVVRAGAPFESVLRPIINFPTSLRQRLKLRADVNFLCNPDAVPLAITLKLFRRTFIYDTCENFSKRLQTRDDLPRWSIPTLAWLQLVAGMSAKKRRLEAQQQ